MTMQKSYGTRREKRSAQFKTPYLKFHSRSVNYPLGYLESNLDDRNLPFVLFLSHVLFESLSLTFSHLAESDLQ